MPFFLEYFGCSFALRTDLFDAEPLLGWYNGGSTYLKNWKEKVINDQLSLIFLNKSYKDYKQQTEL